MKGQNIEHLSPLHCSLWHLDLSPWCYLIRLSFSRFCIQNVAKSCLFFLAHPYHKFKLCICKPIVTHLRHIQLSYVIREQRGDKDCAGLCVCTAPSTVWVLLHIHTYHCALLFVLLHSGKIQVITLLHLSSGQTEWRTCIQSSTWVMHTGMSHQTELGGRRSSQTDCKGNHCITVHPAKQQVLLSVTENQASSLDCQGQTVLIRCEHKPQSEQTIPLMDKRCKLVTCNSPLPLSCSPPVYPKPSQSSTTSIQICPFESLCWLHFIFCTKFRFLILPFKALPHSAPASQFLNCMQATHRVDFWFGH